MASHQRRWVDEPIQSKDDDSLQRAHLAEHTARLMVGTHSWDASVVFGLTGPWGSGKTSLVELIVEELRQQSSEWRVARFTPWATSDTASLMAEFFAALETALPVEKGATARQALKACATVAAPWLNLLPIVGVALGENAKALSEAAGRPKPWNQVFDEASTQLKMLNTPVLVIADDVDRLQADELVALLKVVRLLGRFPGVHYLLAYDEQTLLENLKHAGIGVADAHRARLFMEKIVQYPLTVPPLLAHQMRWRLEEGLTTLFEELGRQWHEDDNRVSDALEAFESQLNTPRSIDRLLAQLRHYLPLHKPEEINDVDLIFLTFLHLQFPELYNALPRWRSTLTDKVQRIPPAPSDMIEPDWGPLLALAPEGDARKDARQVLEELFPVIQAHSAGPRSGPRVCVPEYFNRYFAHTIPQADVADTEIYDALTQASTPGSSGEALITLLTEEPYPGRIDLVLKKLRALSAPQIPINSEPIITLNLVQVVAGLLVTLDSSSRMLGSTQDRGRYWLADLLKRLPPTTNAKELNTALGACTNWVLRVQIILSALTTESTSIKIPAQETLLASAQSLGDEIGQIILEHLSQRDDAPIEPDLIVGFDFLRHFGDSVELKKRIKRRLQQGRFTTEDLAARFVNITTFYSIRSSNILLGGFEQEIFDLYVPHEDDPLYSQSKEQELDESDVSWANRRAYARGRVRPPHVPRWW